MFNFFNKWKRAGRGVGVKDGVGKLCQFDKDGNVISSGVSAADVSAKLYRHTITLQADDLDPSGAPVGVVTFDIISRSSVVLSTFAKLRDAMAQSPTVCAGSFYYDAATVRFPAAVVYRSGSGSTATIVAESNINTGMTAPAVFSFTAATTYQPSDVVKEI